MHVVLFHKRTLVSMMVSLSLFSLNSYSKTKDNITDLGQIQVADNVEKDQQGYAQVYEKDVANIYLGKALIERYQGVSPADLFKSAIGVYSGEARNGGALIRIFVVFKAKGVSPLLWMVLSRRLRFIVVIAVHLIVTILIQI